jgi:hypothetical protein
MDQYLVTHSSGQRLGRQNYAGSTIMAELRPLIAYERLLHVHRRVGTSCPPG